MIRHHVRVGAFLAFEAGLDPDDFTYRIALALYRTLEPMQHVPGYVEWCVQMDMNDAWAYAIMRVISGGAR